MNKEEALKVVNEAPDRADIIVAIFPLTVCERCEKPKEMLYSEYNEKLKRYWEICVACRMDIKAITVAKNKIEREKRRCTNQGKLRKKSIDSSKRKEELLRIAVSV